jgi:hypothetical protein
MKINLLKHTNLSSLLVALCFNLGFSQESFLITKDGNKINVDGSKVELLETFDKFEYQEPNNDKKNKVKLNQIKSAVLGNFHIETFTISNKPKECFIIAEMPEKKLVGYSVTSTYLKLKPSNGNVTNSSNIDTPKGFASSKQTKYFYYILDDSNKVIETLEFLGTYGDKFAKKRDEVEVILRKHFSDCSELIGRLNENDTQKMDLENASKTAKKFAQKFDEGNAKIFMLFDNPRYSLCTKSVNAPIKPSTNETVTIANQDYAFGSTTIDVTGKNNKMSMKGTLSVKDGYFCCVTKYNSTKYKITSYKEGIITCLDSERDLEYTVSIVPENGKESGFVYDTKIIFIVDKKMGGSTSYYWCKKL